MEIQTSKNKEIIDITELVDEKIKEKQFQEGVATLFVNHTTCALTTGEFGEGTDEDLLETLQKIIPKIDFRHAHDPAHAPDHMIASLLGPSLTIPIRNGQLALGTWQRVLLVELNGPRKRELEVILK